MRRKLLGIALVSAAALLVAPVAAQATTVWDFWGGNMGFPSPPLASPNTIVVSSGPFPYSATNTDGLTLKLVPFADDTTGTLGSLTGQDLGPGSDERGAGVCEGAACTTIVSGPSTGHEIDGNEALKLDLSDPASKGYHDFKIFFNSLTPAGSESSSAEIAHIWAGGPPSTGTSLGTIEHSPVEAEEFDILDVYDMQAIYLTSDAFDFLVYGVTADPPAAPEPSTLLLLGAGMLGLVGLRLRRK